MTATEAFVAGPRATVAGAASGPLAGLGFAVKDLIDIAGVATGGGSPDWPRANPVPTRHAWVVQRAAGRRRVRGGQDGHRRGVARHTGRERA